MREGPGLSPAAVALKDSLSLIRQLAGSLAIFEGPGLSPAAVAGCGPRLAPVLVAAVLLSRMPSTGMLPLRPAHLARARPLTRAESHAESRAESSIPWPFPTRAPPISHSRASHFPFARLLSRARLACGAEPALAASAGCLGLSWHAFFRLPQLQLTSASAVPNIGCSGTLYSPQLTSASAVPKRARLA
jgi:hypothetical protein